LPFTGVSAEERAARKAKVRPGLGIGLRAAAHPVGHLHANLALSL